MLIVENNKVYLNVPVLQRCHTDSCNLYRLILQNNFTKRIFVFIIRGLYGNTRLSKIRLCFRFEVADCMDEGEYTYYLVNNDYWIEPVNININRAKSSHKWTDKLAIPYDDKMLIANGMIIVTGKLKATVFNKDYLVIANDNVCITEEKTKFEVNSYSEEKSIISDTIRYLNIIDTGLLKYHPKKDKLCCNDKIYNEFVAKDIYYNQFKSKEIIYEEAED